MEQLIREEIVIGKLNIEKLKNANVCVFGVGGVGGFCVEALVRAGIGNITIVDNDKVNISNLNRQIIALNSTIGKDKVDVLEERIKDINKDCNVKKYNLFYEPDMEFNFNEYDYVIDCIDSMKSKIDIILKCKKNNINIISSMGMGNKINPTDIEVTDIFKTSVDPIAKKLRKVLKDNHINSLKVVYSKEVPLKMVDTNTTGSVSFVPSVAGIIMASEVIKDICGLKNRKGA